MNNTVYVYRNLHKRCWSVMQRGRIIYHTDTLEMICSKFVVRPAGRAKVLRERKKNVHAFVKGLVVPYCGGSLVDATNQVAYNPYLTDTFFRIPNKQPIYESLRVILAPEGKVYAQ